MNYYERIKEKTEMATSGLNFKEWKNEGDFVAGKLVNIEKGIGDNNSTAYTIQNEDGSLISVWDTTVISREFKKLNLLSGDYVGIKYEGWKKGKSGRDYRSFAVTGIKNNTGDSRREEDIEDINEDDAPF